MTHIFRAYRTAFPLLAVIALCAPAHTVTAQPAAQKIVPRNQLEHLRDEDRACLDAVIGEALPTFPKGIHWIPDEPMTRTDLIGKVVVIQSWTCKTTTGRKRPGLVMRYLEQFDKAFESSDLVVLALHTPRGADDVEHSMQRHPVEIPIIVDPIGALCDDLGAYQRPVNLVVDRHGVVRYAGLNRRGLQTVVRRLLVEKFDPKKVVEPSEDTDAGDADVSFPPITGTIRGAKRDIRGTQAPELAVEYWITDKPKTAGKVLVIDFWATWCPPCRTAIPHMNEFAETFGEQVCLIGLSDESPADFVAGMLKYKLARDDFHYALALDPKRRMFNVIQIQGIPHGIVISSDGIVRWQGHPAGLTEKTLRQIVQADTARSQASGDSTGEKKQKKRRWTKPEQD
ncbi:MAG: TlpA family protein disulfide reductase [Phycisphaerales bacterium]|nr:TlpA family protein disulfide reductase [Phycisphaerales bacterium]